MVKRVLAAVNEAPRHAAWLAFQWGVVVGMAAQIALAIYFGGI